MRHLLLAQLLLLPPPLAAEEALTAQLLRCRGEEPFWALDADRAQARLRLPGEDTELPGMLDELEWLPPGWLVWRSLGDATLTITLRAESCRSTMADTPPLDYRAVLVRGSAPAAAGCCSVVRAFDALRVPVADGSAKPAGDWSRLLPDMLGGIRLCVAAGRLAVAEVSRAWPMNHGRMAVRLADADGNRHDCIVELPDGPIERIEAAGAGLPGEGRPVFLPAGERPPMLSSGRLERVLLADGAVAGWLHYPE